jgi:hypothetical protein
MPIYAPTLPPRPDPSLGQNPVAVLMRFELKRLVKHKVGIFFIFGFGLTLIIQVVMLYIRYLLGTKDSLAQMRDFAAAVLTQGPSYQADHLSTVLLVFLWFFLAVACGGLISRDTLYRVRPLIYAHPVGPKDYLVAKGGYGIALLLAILLPFILLPWGLSLVMAGTAGPVWVSLPLRLLPAALIIAALMSAVAMGTSSLAGTPRTGTAWILGVFFGTWALGTLMRGLLQWPEVVSLQTLVSAWPKLFCGVPHPELSWLQASLGTLAHGALWTWIAWTRTRPSEATL